MTLALGGLAAWFYTGRNTSTQSGATTQAVIAEAKTSEKRAVPAGQDAAAALRQRLSQLPQESAANRAASKRFLEQIWSKNPYGKWWLPPLDEVYAELRAAAERGDVEAASVLGGRSAQCRKTVMESTPDKLLAQLEEEMESPVDAEYAQARMATVHERFARELAQYEACSRVGQAALDESLLWLERAGRGDAKDARLAYVATWSEQAGSDRDGLIADIERAAQQRTLAREWLAQGLAAGEDRALDIYIDAYARSGALFPRDRVQELAYGYARDLVRGRRGSGFEALWANGPTRFGDLSSQQWDAIEAQGRAIFKAHYESRPVGPKGAPSPPLRKAE
ncbi:hypothetical protein [Lysobacter antibioticus]|uniref:hypothetical protein n=1 Tax=Lysobacter antibioticus TaxID=84531 RepID=UPI0011873495|nr:hypothetical protein [Lysobacter antibioticus]